MRRAGGVGGQKEAKMTLRFPPTITCEELVDAWNKALGKTEDRRSEVFEYKPWCKGDYRLFRNGLEILP